MQRNQQTPNWADAGLQQGHFRNRNLQRYYAKSLQILQRNDVDRNKVRHVEGSLGELKLSKKRCGNFTAVV